MNRKPSTSGDSWAAARACLGPDGMLSVVMPAYCLAECIGANIARVCDLLDGRIPFEVVPVDDGSKDNTADAIRQAAAGDPRVKPVLLGENVGKGAALAKGFAASRGSHVLLLDGDLDLDPAMLDRFFDVMLQKQAHIVIGSKRHPRSEVDYPLSRRLASRVYYSIVRLLVGLPVTDTQTGMKLFVRPALACALERMLTKRFAFDVELLAIAHEHGFAVAEAPIRMHFGRKLGSLSLENVRTVMNDTLAIFYRLRVLRYYQHVVPCAMPNLPPLVSIVVACPAPSPYLAECLDAISALSYRPFETIVLPDEPADDFPWPGHVRVIPTGKLRPAEKRNLGIEAAKGEIVALLDDDAAPLPDWLDHAIPYFSDPTVGAVGGPAVTPPSDPPLAQAGGLVYASPLVSGTCRYRYVSERVRDVDDLPSCNLLVRTATLRDIGGFRTDFWPGEDTILCLDITRKAKQRIVYDPWSVVRHHRRPLFGPHLRQVGRYALHRGYFAKRFPETSRRISYMVPTIFVCGLVLGAVASFFHPWIRIAYLGALAFYLATTFLASFHPNLLRWLQVWLGVMATHLVYGVRFLQGILSRRMPCEVARFDHPSEKP
jgi:glycosyltransferase involved in cell wall biosynthesis